MNRPLIAAALIAAAAVSTTGTAAAQGNLRASIPAQFRGRWAENQRACRGPEHSQTIITVDRGGWSSFEEGGRVTRVGPVRGATHNFRVHNFAGPSETDGAMALRRNGNRLTMTFNVQGGAPTRHDLVRCR